MREKFALIFSIVFLNSIMPVVHAQYDVRKFGAKGDGTTLDTRSIQSAINKTNENGGGIVEISSGTYMIGTLILKNNVELHLQIGAVLLGSPDYTNYTEIIHKFDSRTKGLYAKYFQKSDPQNLRPFMVRLVNCENVTIRNVHCILSIKTIHSRKRVSGKMMM